METFECDPQRLAKLDRRFANGEAPPSLHHVETSESDNRTQGSNNQNIVPFDS